MITTYIYLAVLLLELLFLIGVSIYMSSMIFSNISGAIYVSTKKREINEFLKEVHLKPNQVFLELGSGDGRVVRTAVQKYGVQGIGVDINPILIQISKIKAKLSHLTTIEFKRENILTTDLSHADIIYIFLMPALIDKISPRIKEQCKKGTLIISHGFKVSGWDTILTKKLDRKPFPTYFYKLS